MLSNNEKNSERLWFPFGCHYFQCDVGMISGDHLQLASLSVHVMQCADQPLILGHGYTREPTWARKILKGGTCFYQLTH